MATYGAAQGGGWLVVILAALGVVIGAVYAIVYAVKFVLRTFLYPLYEFIVGIATGISVYTAANPLLVFGGLALPGLGIALLAWRLEDEQELGDAAFVFGAGVVGAIGLGCVYGLMRLLTDGMSIVNVLGALVLFLLMVLCVLVTAGILALFSFGISGVLGRAGSITGPIWWFWFVLFGNRLGLSETVFGLAVADALLSAVLALGVLVAVLARIEMAVIRRSNSTTEIETETTYL